MFASVIPMLTRDLPVEAAERQRMRNPLREPRGTAVEWSRHL